jgi:hypothetical protein
MFPVLILKMKGFLCPCLISTQEANVINAMANIGTRITYYPSSSSSDPKKSNAIKNIVSGLFQSIPKKHINSSNEGLLGNLSIIDSDQGPSLRIKFDEPLSSSSNDKQNVIKIPLKTIGNIKKESTSFRIIIYARDNSSESTLEVICSFDLAHSQEGDHNDVSDHSEMIIHYLNTILQWNDHRRLESGEEEDVLEDEMKGTNKSSLSQHALKLKHFANREIELKKLKRDREERKQRYLKDSGGLKYTALAMATREIS